MSKIIIVILLSFIVVSIGLEQEQQSETEQEPNEKSEESDEADKYETESRQDFDKKEKEIKNLRKTKKLKENNYRRALESILPVKNTEGYRKFFEELINNSDEQSKKDTPDKEVEEIVVTDTFVDGEGGDDDDPQVEEIEVVIEHISETDNETSTVDDITLTSPQQDLSTMPTTESPSINLRAQPTSAIMIEKVPEEPKNNPSPQPDPSLTNTKGRMGIDSSRSAENMDSLPMARFEERRVMEPYPISRISEVVIPHYRTTLTRTGVVVSPAVYTVQTSSPHIDHVTNRNWIPSRGIGHEYFGRSGGNKIVRSEPDTRLIDDYNDYESNAYSYSPSKMHLTSRQADSKMDILSKLTEGSMQSPLGNLKPLRENLYPGAYYPQTQRYFSDSYRTMFRIRR